MDWRRLERQCSRSIYQRPNFSGKNRLNSTERALFYQIPGSEEMLKIHPDPPNLVFSFQSRPEGRNRRGETRLRGPEVLEPLRGLGIRPLSQSPRKALRASGEALQGPRRGVSVFKGAGKEGGPFRGP